MNVECDKNGRNKGTKCGIANEKEILKDRNVNVSKRQSTSRNKHMDSHKTDYKNSPHKNYVSENSFYDENDSTSVNQYRYQWPYPVPTNVNCFTSKSDQSSLNPC